VKELRDAIPPHCFDRSIVISSLYLIVNLVICGALMGIAYYIEEKYIHGVFGENTIFNWMLALLFWNTYWFVQGAFMTGIWVIAHECGHQSFSKWKSVNDAVGWVLHSMLLVPYHSWRITHGIHHKSTSHMGKDQVYVPKTKHQVTSSLDDVHNAISDSPIVVFFQIFIMLFLGWPFYLAINAWGQDYGRRANHFEPSSPMFKPSQRVDVLVSDLGLILMAGALSYYSLNYSFVTMIKYYGAPYLWVNFWLVLITYLQHTDIRIPHYRGDDWNFIRGALCTIDRDYGVLNMVFHHIGDTHVAHHLFSTMPHYHAQEATKHLKKVLGKYYLTDDTPILKALWKSWNTCHYVDDEGGILYYHTITNTNNKNNNKKTKNITEKAKAS